MKCTNLKCICTCSKLLLIGNINHQSALSFQCGPKYTQFRWVYLNTLQAKLETGKTVLIFCSNPGDKKQVWPLLYTAICILLGEHPTSHMEFIGEQNNTEPDCRLQKEPFPLRILFALQQNPYASSYCNFKVKITWSRLKGHLQNFMCGVSRMDTFSHIEILILNQKSGKKKSSLVAL